MARSRRKGFAADARSADAGRRPGERPPDYAAVLHRGRYPIFLQPGKTVRLIAIREQGATVIVG